MPRRPGGDPAARRADVRAGHRGQPGLPRHARGVGAGGRGDPGRGPRGLVGSAGHGASIAGGMHHAMAAHASGFGVYNDAAVAIAWLLGHGAERIAYVDIDAHHGDGVQAAFYADPRVLTISLHEHPATLFPFTGLPAETGGPGAEGSAVNVALPAGTGDASWLRAFHAIVPPLLRAVPAADPGQPARGRHAPAGSAGPPGAEHRRAARRPCRDPRAGPRPGRRPLAADRRRRV